MKPLFEMYFRALPIRKIATQKYYKHNGAFYPETMNFWGTYNDDDFGSIRKGWDDGYISNPYIRYHWQGGLEISLMMLDYYNFTKNARFAKDTLVPFVSEILTFFNQHWQNGADGKILFSPAISLETWHTAVNPLPEIIGINTVGKKMLALPDSFSSQSQRQEWAQLVTRLPKSAIKVG